MSFITDNTEPKTNLDELKEQATRRFAECLGKIARGFWAYAEEMGETKTKPFDGWQ